MSQLILINMTGARCEGGWMKGKQRRKRRGMRKCNTNTFTDRNRSVQTLTQTVFPHTHSHTYTLSHICSSRLQSIRRLQLKNILAPSIQYKETKSNWQYQWPQKTSRGCSCSESPSLLALSWPCRVPDHRLPSHKCTRLEESLKSSEQTILIILYCSSIQNLSQPISED